MLCTSGGSRRTFLPHVLYDIVKEEIVRNLPVMAGLRRDCYGCLMLVDISGFTKLSEKLCSRGAQGVEMLVTVISDYFAALISIIKVGDSVCHPPCSLPL